MKALVAALVLAVLSTCAAGTALAHESRPVFLGLEQQNGDMWRVTWKRPMRGDLVLGLAPVLPERCQRLGDPIVFQERASQVELWTIACGGPLDGVPLSVAGLDALLTDVLVRIAFANGQVQVARLQPGASTMSIAAEQTTVDVATTYAVLGVEHILFGWDHLLFVLLLVLLAGTWKRILWAVTGFTLAHSLTLALPVLGIVEVPVPLVETLIALSIAVLASDIALRDRTLYTWRAPALVSAAFGLLHGLGFASALRETGIPAHEVPVSLLFFNIGVEAGQLAFVLALVLLTISVRSLGLLRDDSAGLVPAVSRGMVYAVVYPAGILAGFWTIERAASFL
jgi:hydrogenase/urease accessory protein HupE